MSHDGDEFSTADAEIYVVQDLTVDSTVDAVVQAIDFAQAFYP